MARLSLESPFHIRVPGTPSIHHPFNTRTLRVALLLLAVVLLNGIDLAYTLFAQQVDQIGFKEMNPIADSFFAAGLEPSLIAFKILMVFSGSYMLWKLRRSRWTIPGCWILIVAYGCLSMIWYVWIKDVTLGLEVRLAGIDWVRHSLRHH